MQEIILCSFIENWCELNLVKRIKMEKIMKQLAALTTIILSVLAALPNPASAEDGGFCRSTGKETASICQR